MWIASIVGKNFVNGVLTVTVQYTDGTNAFNESIDMTGGTLSVLSTKVKTRLDTLNNTATLVPNIPDGAFTPENPSADQVATALINLNKYNRAIALGLANNTDTVYQNLLTNLKAVPVVTILQYL